MNKQLLGVCIVFVMTMVGCVQDSKLEKERSYIETLHSSWLAIEHAVTEDVSLTQSDMNEGSGIAVLLARKEAEYWTNRLSAQGRAIPSWKKRLEEISKASSEFEGGSAAPLSKNMELLESLRKSVDELGELCKN